MPAGPGGRYRRRGRAAAGIEALAPSAVAFDDIRSRWQAALGAGRPLAPEEDLRTMMPGDRFRLDVPSRLDRSQPMSPAASTSPAASASPAGSARSHW